MFYQLLKIFARPALLIFCRSIVINQRDFLQQKGPLLLACNHPNSFLDAVILDILFKQPVYSLARGDVFRNKLLTRILQAMNIMPVYRTSEGPENLSENYKTFDNCLWLFGKNKLVLIFSEGKCINEWHLRPLKKGTARLALKTWEKNIPLKVLPVGINYNSFRLTGKNVFINFGKIISAGDIPMDASDGQKNQYFNNLLQQQLKDLVYEIDADDLDEKKKRLTRDIPLWEKILLILPGIAGWIIHAPLHIPVKKLIRWKFSDSDHYDSLVFALWLASYPLYLLLLTGLLFYYTSSWWTVSLFLLLPFTAWAWVRVKSQLDQPEPDAKSTLSPSPQ